MNITKTQINAILVAMATLSGTSYAGHLIPAYLNEATSFAQTQSDLNALTFGNLPADIQTVVNNLSNYRTTELNKNIGFIAAKDNADLAVQDKKAEIRAKAVQIGDLSIADPSDTLGLIAAAQIELDNLTGDLNTLETITVPAAAAAVTDSDAKIALYSQAINVRVAAAQTAVANAAADINKARDQFAAGANTANPDYAATGAAGLQSVIDEISNAPAGDQTSVTSAISTADSTFISSGGASTGTLADVQNLVSAIDTQLPNLPPISQDDKDAALASVLNGSYERAAITTEVSTRAALIREEADGSIHIGANSLITNEVGGVQELYAEDALNAPININVTNGSDLLVNGVSVATDADISTEVSNRVSGDASLSTGLSTEVSNRVSGDASLSTGLSTELSNRVSGDLSLSTGLSSEVSSRVSGDLSLKNDVISEASSRVSGDLSLSTGLSSEVSSRVSGDLSLKNDVISEASSRVSGDSSLSTALSTEVSNRLSGDSSLRTDLSTERARALAAEGLLDDRTTALEGRMGNAERNIKTLRKGVAMAAALQTPVINEGDDNAIKVGAAGFDGESGLAIGYARRINESVTVNAELATGFPDVIARGGVNYSF